MAPDPAPPKAAEAEREPDPFASFCARIAYLSAGDRASLRRLFLTRSDQAVGVVTGLLVKAGVPDGEWRSTAAFTRWELLAHVAAVLCGTGRSDASPHRPGREWGLGRALQEAGYSNIRLMRLTSARGPALPDQIVRVARVLAAAGRTQVDLRDLHRLSAPYEARADEARLAIARAYYHAEHASTRNDAP